jgi:transcriptional regulator with XRE-family HTH domain
MTIPEITKQAMEAIGLTQEEFAAALNKSLVNTGIGRVSVSYWLSGKHSPETDILLVIHGAYEDWRREWAAACLCAKLPEAFDRDDHGKLYLLAGAGVKVEL